MNSSATAAAFQDAFNRADWEAIRALDHPGRSEEEWRSDMTYTRGLRNAGYRIESYVLSAYQRPNWAIFNEYDFYPIPEEGVYFSLKDRDGRSQQLFLGLNSSKFCYYLEKKTPRRKKALSAKALKKDAQSIGDFIKKAIKAYAASSSKRVSALEILYSLREGFVGVGLQHFLPYEPGQEPFSQFDCLLMPHWMAATPSPGEIQMVGNLLVEIVLELRAGEQFELLPRHEGAEVSIEESDGMFGWPEYAEHGKANLMSAL